MALKGPQFPPFTAQEVPGPWGFRRWDCLVAFNVQTGQAVQYDVPPSSSDDAFVDMVTPNAVVPTLAVAGSEV
ncbi:hypothetical protein [Alicyclobacillus acidocaldarius]|uniref:hypothetical protein n=1 Tax=Alicyclobacillus acidocaldarius TaxID=405212 RepID=UPI0005A181B4|nr:hypothetical protein [Alicyclobacillus acidocaldarius]